MNRVCLLSGASGALGSAFIERFAGSYDIIGLHLTHPVYAATDDQSFVDPLTGAEKLRPRIRTYTVDVTDAAALDDLIARLRSAVDTVDLLVNAAAIRGWQPLLRQGSADSAMGVFAVNVVGVLGLTAAVARAFWRGDPAANVAANRCVVNVSSTAGTYVYPDLGQGVYAASKAALNQLTYHLASEFWDIGVRVNAVAPDTFPGRTPTRAVLDAIADLDAGAATGTIVPLPRVEDR